jgi:hypothetical protein
MAEVNKPVAPAPAPAQAPKTKAKKEAPVVEDVEVQMMPPEEDAAPGADGNLF